MNSNFQFSISCFSFRGLFWIRRDGPSATQGVESYQTVTLDPFTPPFLLSKWIYDCPIHPASLCLSFYLSLPAMQKSCRRSRRTETTQEPLLHFTRAAQLACVMSWLEHEHGSIRPLLKFPLLSLTLSLSLSHTHTTKRNLFPHVQKNQAGNVAVLT